MGTMGKDRNTPVDAWSVSCNFVMITPMFSPPPQKLKDNTRIVTCRLYIRRKLLPVLFVSSAPDSSTITEHRQIMYVTWLKRPMSHADWYAPHSSMCFAVRFIEIFENR